MAVICEEGVQMSGYTDEMIGVMLCKDCEHFKITAKPMMPYDSGHAHCKKYVLYVDFIDKWKGASR